MAVYEKLVFSIALLCFTQNGINQLFSEQKLYFLSFFFCCFSFCLNKTTKYLRWKFYHRIYCTAKCLIKTNRNRFRFILNWIGCLWSGWMVQQRRVITFNWNRTQCTDIYTNGSIPSVYEIVNNFLQEINFLKVIE